MDSTDTIIAIVIASTALFLGLMVWKLVWFLRRAGSLPRDSGYDTATGRSAKESASGVPDADGGGDA